MSTHRLVQLDREKQNRVHYRRLRVPITVKLHQWVETKNKVGMELLHGIPQRRGDYYPIPVTYTVWAWMYIGIAKYWSPLFDGGYLFKEGRIITPNKSRLKENRYYYFPPTEYSG